MAQTRIGKHASAFFAKTPSQGGNTLHYAREKNKHIVRQASDGKMYFLVLVPKLAYIVFKVPRQGPALRLRVMTKKNNFWP